MRVQPSELLRALIPHPEPDRVFRTLAIAPRRRGDFLHHKSRIRVESLMDGRAMLYLMVRDMAERR